MTKKKIKKEKERKTQKEKPTTFSLISSGMFQIMTLVSSEQDATM